MNDIDLGRRNEHNRQMTNMMFGIEAYETLPNGERRYLDAKEIEGITFTSGELSVPPSNTLKDLLPKARTSLTMLMGVMR